MVLLLVPLGLLLFTGFSAGNDFSYNGEHGPSHWAEEFQTCVGKHQSPINIEEHNVKNTNYEPLRFIGLENPRSSYLVNNGHTVMLRANESEAAMLSGGPLGSKTYVFEQLHFHWGENDWEGSEDLINNHSFAMELHAVFYNKDYETMTEAMKHQDGLTVLAYFYEAGNDTNPTYTPLVNVLPSMELVGTKYALQEVLLLNKLLIPDLSTMEDYFTYEGSLTTPPCLEVVTWIDFKEPQMLSHDQLAAFRNIQSTDGTKLTHNFRPIQPLDDRVVYHNAASRTMPQEEHTEQNQVRRVETNEEKNIEMSEEKSEEKSEAKSEEKNEEKSSENNEDESLEKNKEKNINNDVQQNLEEDDGKKIKQNVTKVNGNPKIPDKPSAKSGQRGVFTSVSLAISALTNLVYAFSH